jgi:hypothetical protein
VKEAYILLTKTEDSSWIGCIAYKKTPERESFLLPKYAYRFGGKHGI